MNRLLASYLLLSGVALLGPHRPAWWPWLALAHGLGAFLLLRVRPAPARAQADAARGQAGSTIPGAPPRQRRSGLTLLRDGYPLLLIPALYAELAPLNRALWGGRYFDEYIIAFERAVFGGLPSSELAPALPWLA